MRIKLLDSTNWSYAYTMVLRQAMRYLILSQIIFYGNILLCIILKVEGVTADSGISYYGVFPRTIVPYTIALIGSAYCLVRVANYLPHTARRLRLLSGLIWICAISIVGVAATPYVVSGFFDILHVACGSLAFIAQLIFCGVIAFSLSPSRSTKLLFSVQFFAGLCSAVYVITPVGYLLETQLIFQGIFSVIFIGNIRSFYTAASKSHKPI